MPSDVVELNGAPRDEVTLDDDAPVVSRGAEERIERDAADSTTDNLRPWPVGGELPAMLR
jgi:hypothetical protein